MFKKLFSKSEDKSAEVSDHDASQLAIAALMVEAAKADENFDEREKRIIEGSLQTSFGIDADAAAQLCQAAEAAQQNAVDIQRFTRIAKEMPAADKKAFIKTLWQVVLSDGDRDPYEDALIRRICGLIYFSDRDSGLARQEAEAGLAGTQ